MVWPEIRSLAAALGMTAALAAAAPSLAQSTNNIPSCYTALHLRPPESVPEQEIFVLIDQTVLLDDTLKASLLQNALRMVRPGSAVTVIAFSAFSQGRYMNVLARGWLEPLPPPVMRNATGARTLKQLDQCLSGQTTYGRRLAAAAIGKAAGQASQDLARSDILASLAASSRVIGQSTSRNKVVLIASDMLENSSISSFYERNHVRLIDADAEMQKAARANVVGNFGGARIFVLGAGLMGDLGTAYGRDQGKQSYRDPLRMNALKGFWTAYFSRSGGRLVEFGEPALLQPVS